MTNTKHVYATLSYANYIEAVMVPAMALKKVDRQRFFVFCLPEEKIFKNKGIGVFDEIVLISELGIPHFKSYNCFIGSDPFVMPEIFKPGEQRILKRCSKIRRKVGKVNKKLKSMVGLSTLMERITCLV